MSYDLHIGDALEVLRMMPSESIQCCVTSPPYWGLRDYGVEGQIGLEPTPEEFVARIVEVFREVRRVLKADGTCWVNLGDSYNNTDKWGGGQNSGKHTRDIDGGVPSHAVTANRRPAIAGLKPKDLVGIPWRVAFALQADGWWLRQDIIWSKPNPMPESVRDRCTKAHEYLFLLTKSARYYYDAEAIKEASIVTPHCRGGKWTEAQTSGPMNRGGSSQYDAKEQERLWGEDGMRNKRSVWTIPTMPCKEAHFATFPEALVEPCILAGSRVGDRVLDPFGGSGTTGVVALRLGRVPVLIELNPEYANGIARPRLEAAAMQPDFLTEAAAARAATS